MGVYQDAILAMPGLVAHWPLSDTTGTAIDDVSPNNLNGTYSGTVTKGIGSMLPGDVSTGGVLCAGGSSFGQVADHPLLDVNAHTVLAWVIPTVLKEQAYLFNRYTQWGYRLNRHKLGGDLGGVTPQSADSLGEMLVPANTYFLAGGYSGSGSRLWLNGALLSDVSASGTVLTGSNPLYLGSSAGVNIFEGVAQHFSLFNRILFDQEVKDLYMLGCGGDPPGFGLVMPWSRKIASSNGLRKRITNTTETRVYLGLNQPAVNGAGMVLQPFGDVRDLGTYTGDVYAKHTLLVGSKAVVVEEY